MTDSAQLEDFRARCKAFLDEHATGIDYAVGESRAAASIAAAKTFQRALTDAGLAGLTYPVEYGGQGLDRAYDRVWREVYGNYPDMSFELTISHGMCLPVLNQFGTDEQKRQFMPKNISGENIWCQMFSEPTRSTADHTSTRCSSPMLASPPTGYSASSTMDGPRPRQC